MKEKQYSEENTLTDTATVNFACQFVKSVKKDSAIEVHELTAFFFLILAVL